MFPPSFALSLFPDTFIFRYRSDLDPSCNIDKVARVGEHAVIACQSVSTEFPFGHGIAGLKNVTRPSESRGRKRTFRRDERKRKTRGDDRALHRELSYANSNRAQPVPFTIPRDSRGIKLNSRCALIADDLESHDVES